MPSFPSEQAGVSSTVSSYLTHPVKDAVTSAFRRFSTDPYPHRRDRDTKPTSSTLSHSPRSCTSPRRLAAPPYQPPPPTPVSLLGFKPSTPSSEQILSKQLAEEIRLLVPPRIQLAETWRLLFSLDQDGSSLHTLYSKCEELSGSRAGFVVAVRDTSGGIFGAYLTDAPQPSNGHYYGHGECFLWRATILKCLPMLEGLPPRPSEDTTEARQSTTIGAPSTENWSSSGTNTPDRIRFKAFPYSGSNDFLIFCEPGYLSVGGGDGHYGLWIDGSLENGVSEHCPTFGNEKLSEEGSKFEVMGVEIWCIGA